MSENYIIYEKIGQPLQVAPAFDFSAPITGPVFLSNSLQMTVHEYNLVALSAPQVGVNTRVIYLRGFESAMFNPKIVDYGEKKIYMDEMSGTYPGLILKIKRPDAIRVRWTDASGNTQTNVFNGITSFAIQRKVDFLDGKLLTERATLYHKEKAFKAWSKWKREQK